MTGVLLDSSVLIKWFHSDGEGEVEYARAIRDAHVAEQLHAHVIDLALYEIGNVLLRDLGWAAADVADQLDDIVTVVGPPLAMTPDLFRHAATLGHEHDLSFNDASWAGAARGLGLILVSADRRLQRAGLAESARATTTRLALAVRER